MKISFSSRGVWNCQILNKAVEFQLFTFFSFFEIDTTKGFLTLSWFRLVLFQLLIPGIIPVLLLESNQGLKLASDEKKNTTSILTASTISCSYVTFFVVFSLTKKNVFVTQLHRTCLARMHVSFGPFCSAHRSTTREQHRGDERGR